MQCVIVFVVVAVAVCGGSGGGYIECTLMTTLTTVSRHKPPSTSPAAKRRPESWLGWSNTITLRAKRRSMSLNENIMCVCMYVSKGYSFKAVYQLQCLIGHPCLRVAAITRSTFRVFVYGDDIVKM